VTTPLTTTITGLPAAVSLSGTEPLAIVQGGTTKQVPVNLITGFGSGTTVQAANALYAGPTSGAAALPAFRAVVLADLPTINVAGGGTGLTTLTAHAVQVGNGTGTVTQIAVPASGTLFQGNAAADPTWTATPTLGVAGATLGSLAFANVTSGSIIVQAVAGALGSVTLSLPAVTDTLAGKALANGGTNAALTASNGGIVWSNATQLQILAGTATANQVLLSGSSATPAWSTATYPATTTINQLLYSSSANVIAGLATANGGILNASSSGVPSLTVTPTLGVQQTTQGKLILANTAAGAFATTLQGSNSASAAWTLTLPTTAGTAGYLLNTDGTGITSWIAAPYYSVIHPSSGNLQGSGSPTTHQLVWSDANPVFSADVLVLTSTDPSALATITVSGVAANGTLTVSFTYNAQTQNVPVTVTTGQTNTQVAAAIVAAIQANATLFNAAAGGNTSGGYANSALIGYITNASSAVVSYDYNGAVSTQIKYTNGTSAITLTFGAGQNATSTNYALPTAWDNNPALELSRNPGTAPPAQSQIGVIQFGGSQSSSPGSLSVQYGSISTMVLNSTTGALSSRIQLITPNVNNVQNQGVYIGAGVYTVGVSDQGVDTISTTAFYGPSLIGGTAASSTLTLESTAGAGTTDSIIFKTGSQSTRGTISTGGFWGINTAPSTSNRVLIEDGTGQNQLRCRYTGLLGFYIGQQSNAQLNFFLADAGNLLFGTNNGSVAFMQAYASGGFSFGATPVDAGNNNLYVQGKTGLGLGGAPSHYAQIGAGTTAIAPILLTSGTNLTSPLAGAIEYDGTCIYGTSVASSRQVAVTEQFQSLTADYTLTDSASAQKAFNASTNGALTVAASTAYDVDAVYYGTNTGTTSHTWGVLFAGAATITAAGTNLFVQAYTATSNALTAVSGIYIVGAAISSVTAVTAASTSATENVVIKIRGRININGGGTLIPQVKFSAQPNGTEKVLAGSFIRLWPVGAGTVTNVGNWS